VASPLPVKLGIKRGSRVYVGGAPEGFALEDVRVLRRASAPLDVALFFMTRRAELERRFAPLRDMLDRAGGLWVAWPKQRSSLETDLTFAVVQQTGLDAGLVDNKSCAIDDDWQALRFVYRLRDR
jgi:hypothetical protein